MMKTKSLFLVFCPGLTVAAVTAFTQQIQPPRVEWVRNYGGNKDEYFQRIDQIPNGGYVLQGASYSGVSGDRTVPNVGIPAHIEPDLWSISLDARGNKTAEKAEPVADAGILRMPDGGAIVYHTVWTNRFRDVRLERIDADGQRLWDHTYGGSGDDDFRRIFQLQDGGFILAGSSDSAPGGNKTSPNYGSTDYWVMRLDFRGEIVWDKTFGGSGMDSLNDALLTTDGGILLAGLSGSCRDGNKTSEQYGPFDFWIVKIGIDGTKEWENSFGGVRTDHLQSVAPTADGGFLLVGWTFSFLSGSNSNVGSGGWIVRTDAKGNKLWDTVCIAEGQGYPWSEYQQTFLDGAFETSDGRVMAWGAVNFYGWWGANAAFIYLVRLDPSGRKLWHENYGRGTFNSAVVQQTPDKGFIIGGETSVTWENDRSYDLLAIKLAAEDDDGDGIPNHTDLCPGTPPGAIVDLNGCSVDQLCPCEGSWASHGEYLKCVNETMSRFFRASLISEKQRVAILRQAAESDCGRVAGKP